MKVDIDSLIELIKKNVYENHRQDVTAIMVQDAVSAVARNVGVSVNQLYDNLETNLEDITNELNKKLDKEVYNLDKEEQEKTNTSLSNGISENKTAIESNKEAIDNKLALKLDKEVYNLDKEEQEKTNTSLSKGISENKTAIDSNKESYELDKESQKELDEKQNIDLAKHSKSIDELNNLVKVATSKDEPILTAEGGGVISLPSNAMSSVAPNYRINGLTNEELKSVQTPMRIKSVGENLLRINDVKVPKVATLLNGVLTYSSSQNKDSTYIYFTLPKGDYYFSFNPNGSPLTNAMRNIDKNVLIIMNSQAVNRAFSLKKKTRCRIECYPSIANVECYFDSFSISRNSKIDYTPYTESNLYINNQLELKSVGEVSDYIENGKLYKFISDDGEILEKTEVVNLSTSGQIVNKPNGTIFIEPVTNITDYYTDSLDVSEYNIVEIEEFSYYKEGVYHQLDTSKVVINEGKLTYPNLENTIVYMVFKYDDNPIYGVNSVDYYNDKGVLVSPDGSFWKPTMEVSDEGSITLKGEKL